MSQIKGKQIKDDTLTGDDVDESTLVIDLQMVTDVGSETTNDLKLVNVLPNSPGSYSLGSTTDVWSNGYFENLIVSNQIVVSSDTANQELIRLQKGENDSRFLVFESEGTDRFEMFLNSFENFTFTTTNTTDDILFRLNGHTALYMQGYPKEIRLWDSYNSAYITKINSALEIDGEVGFKRIQTNKVSGISAATGTVTHDCSNGAVFIHDSISGTFSADFTNLNIPAGHSCDLKLILEQGSTAYMCDGIKINSTGKTINWEGGSAPSGTANGVDEILFSILYDGTDYMIFGSSKSF